MLVRRKMKKSKKLLLGFIILVILLVIIVIIYTYFNKNFDPLAPIGLGNLNEPIVVTSSLDSSFDLDFLNKKPYRSLKESASLPVKVSDDEQGRTNPFREINFFISN